MNIKKQFDLSGRTALITGSSQGIGQAIALGLAEYGANIIIHGRNELALAEETAAAGRALGVRAEIITCDLADSGAAQTIYKQATALFPTIDILVLNASVQIRKAWQMVTPEEFELQTNVNWRSALQLAQLFSPAMQKQKWGRIVTIGSVQQVKPHPDMMVYSATKSAQVNLVKSLAAQLGKDGITVNNIAPGVFKTGRNEEALADENYSKQVQSRIPVNFFAEPADCAPLALLLCSEAGRYITGQDYFIDGGLSL